MLTARLMSENNVFDELKFELNVLHEFVNSRIVEIEKKYNCELLDMSSMAENFEDKKFIRFYLIPCIDTSKV